METTISDREGNEAFNTAVNLGILERDSNGILNFSTGFVSIAEKTPEFLNPALAPDVGIMHAINNYLVSKGKKKASMKKGWLLSLVVIVIMNRNLRSDNKPELPLYKRENKRKGV